MPCKGLKKPADNLVSRTSAVASFCRVSFRFSDASSCNFHRSVAWNRHRRRSRQETKRVSTAIFARRNRASISYVWSCLSRLVSVLCVLFFFISDIILCYIYTTARWQSITSSHRREKKKKRKMCHHTAKATSLFRLAQVSSFPFDLSPFVPVSRM